MTWRSYLPTLSKEWREIKEGIDGAIFKRKDGLMAYFRVSYEHNSFKYICLKICGDKPKAKLDPASIEDAKHAFVLEEKKVEKVFLCQQGDDPAACYLWFRLND